jgi:hypothetical protein
MPTPAARIRGIPRELRRCAGTGRHPYTHIKGNASVDQNVSYQRAVDTDGSQLVVGQHVSQSEGGYAELENGVASIPSQLGKPESVLADAGYVNADAFDRLGQGGVEIHCACIARTPTTSATTTFGRGG